MPEITGIKRLSSIGLYASAMAPKRAPKKDGHIGSCVVVAAKPIIKKARLPSKVLSFMNGNGVFPYFFPKTVDAESPSARSNIEAFAILRLKLNNTKAIVTPIKK